MKKIFDAVQGKVYLVAFSAENSALTETFLPADFISWQILEKTQLIILPEIIYSLPISVHHDNITLPAANNSGESEKARD